MQLRLFAMIVYDCILDIDADTLIQRKIDEIFYWGDSRTSQV
jgi:alpha-N-acetylglucosamine transferase